MTRGQHMAIALIVWFALMFAIVIIARNLPSSWISPARPAKEIDYLGSNSTVAPTNSLVRTTRVTNDGRIIIMINHENGDGVIFWQTIRTNK